MADECISAAQTIDAPAEVIFDVLADPAKHAAIDGTGWVCESLDSEPLTAAGQIFRMAMYHPTTPTATTRSPTGSRCSTVRTPFLGRLDTAPATAP